MNGTPLLDSADNAGRLALNAGGLWTAERAGELERLIERVIARHCQVDSRLGGVDIDMAGVERLDTFGAWLLERLMRGLEAAGGQTHIIGLPEHYRGLVLQARGLNLAAHPAPRENAHMAALALVGRSVGRVGHDFVAVLDMIGALAAALGRGAPSPTTGT